MPPVSLSLPNQNEPPNQEAGKEQAQGRSASRRFDARPTDLAAAEHSADRRHATRPVRGPERAEQRHDHAD